MDLLQAFNTFADVAKPIILKSDMLRLGVKFSEAALRDAADREDILFKGFACFAYSRSKTAVYAEKIPEDLYIDDGTPEGTPVQLRLSDDTPYLIDLADARPAIFWNGEVVGTGRYSPMPRFYRRSLDGFPMASYAHAVGDLSHSISVRVSTRSRRMWRSVCRVGRAPLVIISPVPPLARAT